MGIAPIDPQFVVDFYRTCVTLLFWIWTILVLRIIRQSGIRGRGR